MEFEFQIGKVVFRGCLPFPYRWREEERQFLNRNPDAEKTVSVEGVGEPFDLPVDAPLASNDQMQVWGGGAEEVRAYRATFYPDHPVYAMSRRSGDSLWISFQGNLQIFTNPNMHIWNLIQMENFLLETEGIILHSCYTMYRDQAILFTAPSGTGKTTQANIWKRVYGSRVINGDKCLLQRHRGQWQAWGFPLHGSAPECENLRYPIGAIVIVRQAKTDWVEEIGPAQKLGLLYTECTVNNWDPQRMQTALTLLSDLIGKVRVLILHCTMEDNAAHTLHDYLYGGGNGTV